MSLYRDPLANLQNQIAQKRGLLASRERELPVLMQAMLPLRLARIFVGRRSQALASAETLEALGHVDAALDEVLAAHEEAAALLPKLRRCPLDVPDPPKESVGPPWAFEEPDQLAFRSKLTKRLATIDVDSYVVRWGDHAYLARLVVAHVPVVLLFRFEPHDGGFRAAVRTSVPRALPSLRVRPERWLDGVGRAFGIVHDAEVGNEPFDAAFVVSAPFEVLPLLDEAVTRDFCALEELAPALVVQDGIAELTWHGSANADMFVPESTFAILLRLRAMLESV